MSRVFFDFHYSQLLVGLLFMQKVAGILFLGKIYIFIPLPTKDRFIKLLNFEVRKFELTLLYT